MNIGEYNIVLANGSQCEALLCKERGDFTVAESNTKKTYCKAHFLKHYLSGVQSSIRDGILVELLLAKMESDSSKTI